MSDHSPFPSCFRRPTSAANPATTTTTTTTNPNLTTCLYTTEIGLFALSWSRSGLFTRSLHLHHHISGEESSFHLQIRPSLFFFYTTSKGSKKLSLAGIDKPAKIHWDLSGAKYGSGPEPVSGFHVTVVVDGEIVLKVGDCEFNRAQSSPSPMVLKREHICGTKNYSTKVKIGGYDRTLIIDCDESGSGSGSDPRLLFTVDGKIELEIKHLKWKFRGNETIEIDGTLVQVSWDVYNWLFDTEKRRRFSNNNNNNNNQDGYALFMFTVFHQKTDNATTSLWSQPQFQHHQQSVGFGFGFELEEKRMKRRTKGKAGSLLMMRPRAGRTSSSSSFSSANSCSSCNSSVMEWANSEDEDQFTSYPYSAGFSLLVYAWN